MTDEPNSIDLKLWLDQDIIPRQNRLKAKFWNILSEVGNTVELGSLSTIHEKSRGIKLSKGNDLLGYPYQVLDLIRDFNPEDGLNIRLLNWFGHGLFIFVLIGKNHPKAPLTHLNRDSWLYDLAETQWDYPEILLNNAARETPTENDFKNSVYYQWHKEIKINSSSDIKARILGELKNLSHILIEKMG
tara:strand:- start:373 stop:936 length:564 start_codon:yes stop_codon:yes gene_type:complete